MRGMELEQRSLELASAVGELEQREARARELHVARRADPARRRRRARSPPGRADRPRVRAGSPRSGRRPRARRQSRAGGESSAQSSCGGPRWSGARTAVRTPRGRARAPAGELAALARRLDELGARSARSGGGSPGRRVRRAARRRPLPARFDPRAAAQPGATVESTASPTSASRVTTSPLPGDDRRCALLERARLPCRSSTL